MTSTLLKTLDGALTDAVRLARHLPILDPLAAGLPLHRQGLCARLYDEYAPRIAPLEAAVIARDPDATRRFDGFMDEAMDEMRAARPHGPRAALGALDRLLYKNDEEILDDPDAPEAARVRIIETLDWLNQQLDNYRRWACWVEDLVSLAESRRGPQGGPVRIYDLAAGHGGFALELQERLGARVEVTATDLFDAYLAVGRRAAAERASPVRFAEQDATDLRNLRGAGVDIFLCTQSLHHFPPGMVSRIFGQAAACARTGVCFIDAERGVLPLMLVPLVMAAHGRTWPVFHDTWVSLRRMYFAEELALLAQLAPGLPAGARVESERAAPGYACVRVLTTKE